MATPNIVPRADSEGGLGTASKYWASAYIDAIVTGALTVSSRTSGDATLIIESDTDNNAENDNPQLQFKQDGGNTIAKLGLTGDAGTIFTNSLANAAYFGNDALASVQLYTNATARLTINESGKVGIGTTSPQKALDISAAITAGGGVLRLSGTGNGSQNDQTGAIEFFSADTTDNSPGVFAKIRGVAHASGGEGSLQFVVDMPSEGADASTIAMHVNPDGKVGVGVIAPASLLHVAGTVQVGVDDTGHDVKFFGATASVFLHWDESADRLIFTDNAFLAIGSSSDLLVYHDASNSHILNSTGNFHITNNQDDGDIVFKTSTGSATAATYLTLDGSATNMKADTDMIFADNKALMLGTGGDAFFKHDGSNFSFINDVGNVTFTNRTDDGDIIFQSDDGSGGVETYFFLDGSVSSGNPVTVFPDNSQLMFGDALDLRIWHDGSNSYIADTGTGTLNISGSSQVNINAANGENGVQVIENAGVKLRHNNVVKLETTGTGISVAGAVASTFATGNAAGAGFNTSGTVAIDVGEINGEIITTIKVDIGTGAILSSGTAGDVIGEDDTEGAFLTRITTAVNGIVYRGEMICVEVPTTGDADINLAANSSATLAEDGAGEGEHVLIDGGTATLAKHYPSFTIPSGGIQNDHLYLTHGGTTAGTYGAGQFIIKLYGAAVVS